MLPPHELKNKTFTRSIHGYNPVEVDEYIEFVIGKYTDLYRENDELERKLKTTIAKLDEIKGEEDQIRATLLEAKRAAGQIRSDAEDRADSIIRSAKTACNTILADYNERIEDGRATLAALQEDITALKAELFDRYSRHIRYIDKLTEGIETVEIEGIDELRKKAIDDMKAMILAENPPSAEPESETKPDDADDQPDEPIDDAGPAGDAGPINGEPSDEAESSAELFPDQAASDNEASGDPPAADETAGSAPYSPSPLDEALDKAVDQAVADIPLPDLDEEEPAPKKASSNDLLDLLELDNDIPAPKESEPGIPVVREPVKTSGRGSLLDEVADLNRKAKEASEPVRTPDSDTDDDESYLSFVKSVTGRNDAEKESKSADFDLLFSDAGKAKKKK